VNYREEKGVSKKNKEEYLQSIEELLDKRQRDFFEIRKEYAKGIFKNQERCREDLKKMLGWPLVGYEGEGLTEVSAEKLSDEEGYSVWRMQFTVLDGVKISGLFFRQKTEEKKPLVLVQHGGWGTPEVASGFYGNTFNNNDMLHRVIKYGVHAFAPQLLLWKEDEYEVDFNRRRLDARFKRVGSSITAIEIFALRKILDYFEARDYVSRFGMIGLSYGGFYTLFTAAVEKRIKSCISCSFFNKRDSVGWEDWVWRNSAEKFDDAEVACLVYPRKLCIRFGDKDEMFDYKGAVESFERVKELCSEVGTDWIDFELFDGKHEVFKNDEPIENMIKDLK